MRNISNPIRRDCIEPGALFSYGIERICDPANNLYRAERWEPNLLLVATRLESDAFGPGATANTFFGPNDERAGVTFHLVTEKD